MEGIVGKTVKTASLNKASLNLYIEFTDGTTLEVGLDCYDFDRYQLEVEIN